LCEELLIHCCKIWLTKLKWIWSLIRRHYWTSKKTQTWWNATFWSRLLVIRKTDWTGLDTYSIKKLMTRLSTAYWHVVKGTSKWYSDTQHWSKWWKQYQPTRYLHSFSSHQLFIPRHNLSCGPRAFCFSAPHIWNSFPLHIQESQPLLTDHLKTHFSRSLSHPLYTNPPKHPDSFTDFGAVQIFYLLKAKQGNLEYGC